jgi:hypothetical protein
VIETRWFGLTVMKHPRAESGPLVWTLLVRIGRKARLGVEW